jgi:origin recognition complex subunit 3
MTNSSSSSWLDRIPFGLLFGIATSVELFQARLLKSTCFHLYGEQFDVEQSTSVIEKIFRTAVAHVDAPLRLGPSLMQSLLERQQDQVAGPPMFVNSLKVSLLDFSSLKSGSRMLTAVVRLHVSLLCESFERLIVH